MPVLKWSYEVWIRIFALFFVVMLSTTWFSKNVWRYKTHHWLGICIAILAGLWVGHHYELN